MVFMGAREKGRGSRCRRVNRVCLGQRRLQRKEPPLERKAQGRSLGCECGMGRRYLGERGRPWP